MKKWGIAIVIVVVIAALYYIEFSKVKTGNETSNAMPTLDNLEFDEAARNWEDFYKVRAIIIDGQTAEFDIPKRLRDAEGGKLTLTGAAVFFSPGCKIIDNKVSVHSFFIYPTLGLANACEHLPEIAMRWTVRINLESDWLVSRTDMIDVMVKVTGTFRIDKNKPYESVFFLDNAEVEIVSEEEVPF